MRHFRSGCPIASALDLFGDRWSLLVIRSMIMGASSYSDLAGIPEAISSNVLADRLRRLEEAGLIEQVAIRRGAAKGRYRLTAAGAGLIPVLQELARWGEANIPQRWATPERFRNARPQDFETGDGGLPGAD